MYLSSAGVGSVTAINFDRINFDSGSAVLSPEARDQIDNIATILRAYPRATVTIAGYTDKEGSETANMALSKARAEAVAGKLTAAGVPFLILEPPDGDAAFREFHRRWTGRAVFLRGALPEIADAVRTASGAIATDNFLGHMAGYYGKPVLWINISSPAEQVEPRGPRTRAVHRPTAEEAWRAFEALRAPAG